MSTISKLRTHCCGLGFKISNGTDIIIVLGPIWDLLCLKLNWASSLGSAPLRTEDLCEIEYCSQSQAVFRPILPEPLFLRFLPTFLAISV